jgi:nucleoside-diphosphate-sugar epimerase
VRIVVVGALGAVGSSVAHGLVDLGHDVVRVSSRAPLIDDPAVLSFEDAIALMHSGDIDLVVHAAGPGDHRSGRDTWESTTSLFGSAIADAGVRGILLSTTRVLEGYETDFSENSQALARTEYALKNARNEESWLVFGGHSAVVLRLANFFSSPVTLDSPQAALLPWSLVTEALDTGAIGIRSGANFAKEFVSGADIARAVVALGDSTSAPSIVATVPGLRVSMSEFAGAVQRAFNRAGLPTPEVGFGPDGVSSPQCSLGWLATAGWKVELLLTTIEDAIVLWITSLSR